jgi:hypothetical protein
MDRSQNGQPLTVAGAKSRIIELGRSRSPVARVLRNPFACAGILMIGGAVAGRLLGRRSRNDRASLVRLAIRAGTAAAPLLVQQLVRGVTKRAAERSTPTGPAPKQDSRRTRREPLKAPGYAGTATDAARSAGGPAPDKPAHFGGTFLADRRTPSGDTHS